MSTGSLAQERLLLADARRRWGETAEPAAVAAWFAENAEVEYLAGCFGAALKDAGYARRMSADLAVVAAALRVIGCVRLERGDQTGAVAALEESRLAAGPSAQGALAEGDLAFALAESGRLQEAIEICRRGRPEPTGWARGRVVRALLRAGIVEEERAEQQKSGFGWIQLDLAAAEIRAARGDQPGALELAGGLVERMGAAGVRAHVGDALLVRMRALAELGAPAEQADAREELRRLALSLGSRRLLLLLG